MFYRDYRTTCHELGGAMPTLELKITVPDGTTVNITGLEGVAVATPGAGQTEEDAVERYWRHYLSDNTRKLLAAAARLEDFEGPGFTLEDVAKNLNVDYESARSYKQTLGRPARRWQDDNGTREPIRLQWSDYHPAGDGMRTVYYLPEGMGETILRLAAEFMVQPVGNTAG
jgi:hypothetical protein